MKKNDLYILAVLRPNFSPAIVWSGNRLDTAEKRIAWFKKVCRIRKEIKDVYGPVDFIKDYFKVKEWTDRSRITFWSGGFYKETRLILLEETKESDFTSGGVYAESSRKPSADESNFLHVGRDNSYFLEKYLERRDG